jgi:putative tricarboxylic transport membrane protein
MKRCDQIVGFIWFALGSGMALEAIHLGLGELRLPGIGFMPFLVGVLLAVSGCVLTLFATLKGKEGDDKSWAGENWKNIILPLLALFIYIGLMEPLGFLLSTFLLIFFLFKMTAPKKWLAPLVTSGVIVFFSYLIFFVWLKVPLPKGFFGVG